MNRFVYHGSSKYIIGRLEPRQARDVKKQEGNEYKGVYATDVRKKAIIMAILTSKGVKGSSLSFSRRYAKGVIYEGWPKQKQIFLYTLSSKNFNFTSPKSHQLVSYNETMPLKVDKISISRYIHLVRRASRKEKIEWSKWIKR